MFLTGYVVMQTCTFVNSRIRNEAVHSCCELWRNFSLRVTWQTDDYKPFNILRVL